MSAAVSKEMSWKLVNNWKEMDLWSSHEEGESRRQAGAWQIDKVHCSTIDKSGVVEMAKWRFEDIRKKFLQYSEIPALAYAMTLNKDLKVKLLEEDWWNACFWNCCSLLICFVSFIGQLAILCLHCSTQSSPSYSLQFVFPTGLWQLCILMSVYLSGASLLVCKTRWFSAISR